MRDHIVRKVAVYGHQTFSLNKVFTELTERLGLERSQNLKQTFLMIYSVGKIFEALEISPC